MQTNRDIVERYADAITSSPDELERLRHPDYVEDWPQSGERVRGPANMRAIDEHYPGRPTEGGVMRVLGGEDRWVVTPSYTTLRIEGTGDVYTVVSRAIYPPDSVWYVTSIIELRAVSSSGGPPRSSPRPSTLPPGAPSGSSGWRKARRPRSVGKADPGRTCCAV